MCGPANTICMKLTGSCNLKPCNGMLLMALHDNNVLAPQIVHTKCDYDMTAGTIEVSI